MAAEKSLVMNSSSEKAGKKSYTKLVDVVIIAFSICTLLVDLVTDLFLVYEYSEKGLYSWAALTLALVLVPTLIVELFSIRWHSLDGNATFTAWMAHVMCLGIAHRYVEAIRTAAVGTSQTLLQQQRDLCMLHLFNSFLESAPQLILQLYVTASLGSLLPWTGVSLAASLFSLAWAIASYTRAMRLSQPDKKPASGAALAFQALWRAGTLTARIVSLAVLAIVSPTWMLIFLGVHWAVMTAWAVGQRTDFCETWWEERAYNAVVGVIYCFCFFNLQEGPSRSRASLFYLLVTLENVLCVVAFALWGGNASLQLAPSHDGAVKLLVLIVALSTLIGLSSMLLYYAFFHPAGVIFPFMPKEDCEARQNLSDDVGRNTLRSLRHEPTTTPNASPSRPPSSVALSTLENSPTISEKPPILELSSVHSGSPDNSLSESAKLKRRPICDISLSELDAPASPPPSPLPSLLDDSPPPPPPPPPLCRTISSEDKDEVSSTCPSAHDYENMCAVGITRETWGLRHWDGYSSDIAEHDSSVARGLRDTRRDTLVSSSTYSSLSSNYSDSESDTYTYVRTLGLPLTPIAEEEETGPPPIPPHASCSSLVATIEEIRLSNQDLYNSTATVLDESVDDGEWAWQPLSQTEIDFLAQLQPPSEQQDKPPVRVRRKFSLLRERFELAAAVEEGEEHTGEGKVGRPSLAVTLVPVAS